MLISLIKRPEKLTYSYGNIPDIPNEPEDIAQTVVFDFSFFAEATDSEIDEFELRFLGPMNRICSTLLDYGDVDYVDFSCCTELAAWLDTELDRGNMAENERIFFDVLRQLALEASQLKTGLVIELT